MTTYLEATASLIRKLALIYIQRAGSGHPGGSLSVADILTALYFNVTDLPNNPKRDLIILDKGHSCPSLYAAWELLIANGLPVPDWWGDGPVTLRKIGSAFQGHPSVLHTPWCELSSGSLGSAFSAAVGMALALKDTGRKVYVILGDGGMMEGVVAEAARAAARFELANLIVIVDYNRMASDRYGWVPDPLKEFAAWGWQTMSCNGHDIDALTTMLNLAGEGTQPTCIVADTIKGRGWYQAVLDADGMHGSVTLSEAELKSALEGLG